MTKKALILTGINNKLHPLFSNITNRKAEELMVLNSYETEISQPYGCLIRNMIRAVYFENVEEIYIIDERSTERQLVQRDELLAKFKEMGVAEGVIDTIEYIDVVGNDVFNWLIGSTDEKIRIKKNINLIHQHPFMPKSVSVYGFIANAETGEYEAV
ncbi:hypothetical protein [Bacillus sp. B15-48]|uniref:hypothetical protein n=1 Tax=Bacillus sp. B15-48 TaxID=1548601 RepID=UPI00193F28E8|nr:hypothetical protein [Bacillus sp. B15-48]MBM4765118.1 hypothetical protein [Bacillus sp. B15-48]